MVMPTRILAALTSRWPDRPVHGLARILKKRSTILLYGSACCLALSVCNSFHPAQAADQEDADVRATRIASNLLKQMTLQEKLNLIRGTEEPAAHNDGEAGYLPGVKRLNVPPLRMADGPPGLLLSKPSVAEVATMGVAATFDPKLAFDNGVLIADEANRLNIDVVLQPFINIDRDITYSRAYNTFGEDPTLTSMIGAAEIRGIQSRNVMADAKHFIGYDTDGQHVFIDEQPLHEIYLAPFEAAINAHVASIMCAYNMINGPYACANRALMDHVLRDELGFKGFVVSDWGAVHDNLGLTAGLDMEMPGHLNPTNPFAGIIPAYYDNTPPPHHVPPPDFDAMHRIFEGTIPEEPQPEPVKWDVLFPVNHQFRNLYDALHDGAVTQAEIDRAAGRVLFEMALFGRLPGTTGQGTGTRLTPGQVDDINERTSAASAVLLRNVHHALPLTPDDLTDLAVIGPGGSQVIAVGKPNERSLGEPDHQVSPVTALRQIGGGKAHIQTAVADDMDGHVIAADHVISPVPQDMGRKAGQAPLSVLTAATGTTVPAGSTMDWSGDLQIDEEGEYWLCLHVLGARADIIVDGTRIGGTHALKGGLHGDIVEPNQDNLLPGTDGLDNVRVPVKLATGRHKVVIHAVPDDSDTPERLRLAWATPATRRADRDHAVDVARHARKVILFLWSRGQPPFQLPGEQNELAEAVLAANPHTVIMLNTSQPVALPWLDKAPAVMEMWWSGDRGGVAAARVLTGQVNPAGRLPVTWGRQLSDYPATDPMHKERSGAGQDEKTVFSEGVNIGYRAFLKSGRKPLFPFGHGLSYSRFAYSRLHIDASNAGGLDVRFRIRNSGGAGGDEVPQVYIDAPGTPVPGADLAVRSLVAFDRVHLDAGESRDITLHVAPRALQYWSTHDHAWRKVPGTRPVLVGASSGDIRLKGRI